MRMRFALMGSAAGYSEPTDMTPLDEPLALVQRPFEGLESRAWADN